MTATDREDPASETAVAMTEVGDDGRDLLWGEELTGPAEEAPGIAREAVVSGVCKLPCRLVVRQSCVSPSG